MQGIHYGIIYFKRPGTQESKNDASPHGTFYPMG